jgi:hypothetical protein
VILNCKLPRRFGSVRVNGEFNICAELLKMVVSPLVTSIGNDIDLQSQAIDRDGNNNDITTLWSNDGGVFDDPTAESTTYTCLEVGIHLITVSVTDDDEGCDMATWTVPVECVPRDGLECKDDEDCDEGEMCVDNECVPEVECENDLDCDKGEMCLDNECVPEIECVEDEDCELGEVCVSNKCVPDLECVDDENCDEGEVCVDNECVPELECTDNDDCDPGDICLDNECRDDPDLFCDTGLCVEDAGLRAECVEKFFLCLAENPDEEECVALSIAICTECNTGLDCDDGNECTDDLCTVAGVCSNPNNVDMCDAGSGPGSGTCNAGMCEAEPACSDVIDFEDACGPYVFSDFAGGVATVVDNPDSSGINTTAKVAQMQKFAGEVFGGSTLALDGIVDWTKGTAFTMKVWASREVPVLFKLEGLNQERSADQTGSSSWEELCYDFTGSTGGADATAITFIFDLGVNGDAGGNPDDWTFFFDGIVQTDSCGGGECVPPALPNLTVNGDFETGDTCGWEFFPNDGTFAATMAQSNGGAWSGNLVASVPGGGGPASFPVIKQANIGIGTVTANSPITISVDLLGSLAGAGGVVFVEFFSELSGGGTSKSEILGQPVPTASWTTHTFNTTTGPDVSGGVTLQLKTDCGANPGCTVDTFWDNVSVTVP